EPGHDAGARAAPHHRAGSVPSAASHGRATIASIQQPSIAHSPAPTPSAAVHAASDSSASTRPATVPCRRSAAGNRQRQFPEPAYSASADSSATIAPAIVTPGPARRARAWPSSPGSPLEPRRRGHPARVAVIAPVRRIAGTHVLLVGQVLHVQLQAPVAEVVVDGGVEQGVRRRFPLVGYVAEMLADVAHARAEAKSSQRAAGDGVVAAKRCRLL